MQLNHRNQRAHQSKIQNLDTGAEVRTQGTVVSLTDGIARVHGLSDAMQGEMIEFPKKHVRSGAQSRARLGRHGDPRRLRHITEGDTVKCTGRILEVPVGPELMGRVVDALASRSTARARSTRRRPT